MSIQKNRTALFAALIISCQLSFAQTDFNRLEFSHPSGFYDWLFVLKVKSANGDTIRYTSDGSMPEASSAVCHDSLPVTPLMHIPDTLMYIRTSPRNNHPGSDNFKANVFRFASFKNGRRTSPVYSQTYFVGLEKEARYPGVPIVSIITDANNLFHPDSGIYVPGIHYSENNINSGNYYQKGMDWERLAQVQFFDSTGSFLFGQDLGIRIHGRIRDIPQKSLRLCPRKLYGQSTLTYPFFPGSGDTVFHKMVLRNSMGCWQKTLFSDQLSSYLCRDLHVDITAEQAVIVFINGEYWGIHALREYFNDEHLAQKFGLSKDSINIVSHDFGHPRSGNLPGAVEEGSGIGLIELYRFLDAHDLAVQSNYARVQEMLDMQSVIDYYCAEIFFNNRDWPGNNNILWSAGRYGKWRQGFYDLDAAWSNSETNTLGMLMANPQESFTDPSELLFQKLMESAEFRLKFFNRMNCLLKNDFSQEKLLAAIDRFEKIYSPLMDEHARRWSNPGSKSQWEGKVNLLRMFAKTRHAYVNTFFNAVFGAEFEAGLLDCETLSTP